MRAIVANRLTDGEVVFWNAGRWVEQFAEAQLYDEKGSEDADVAQAKSQATIVVEPYPIEVTVQDGVAVPVSYRERLRALGPTNEPTHGKQAVGGHEIEALIKAVGGGHTAGRIELLRKS
jgi:sulfite reductase (NADPH) hemoprotein beta-component